METIGWIIATSVLVVVIVLLAVLFFFLIKYEKKIIINGLDDETIFQKINDDIDKYQRSNKEASLESFKKYHYKNRKYGKIGNVFIDIFLGLLGLILLAMMVCSLVFKSYGNNMTFGNTTYVIVQDNSMSVVDSSNTYIESDKDQNEYLSERILQYSLIGLDKYESSDLINKYDIVAFKNNDSIIVHRVIAIAKDADSKVYYTLKADGYGESNSYELAVSESLIVGVFNGFNNTFLGRYITFLQSYTGVIIICLFVLLMLFYDVLSSKLDKVKKQRYDKLLEDMIFEKGVVKENTDEQVTPIETLDKSKEKKLEEKDIVYFARQQKIRRK